MGVIIISCGYFSLMRALKSHKIALVKKKISHGSKKRITAKIGKHDKAHVHWYKEVWCMKFRYWGFQYPRRSPTGTFRPPRPMPEPVVLLTIP